MRSKFAIGALVGTALLFAACGSDDDSSASTEAPVTTAAPAPETTAAPAPETTAAPAPETTAAPAPGELPDLSGKSFTFAGFGGALQENQDAAWFKPFAEATGATITQPDVGDLAAIQTQQDAGNVQWDVVETEAFTVDSNCGTVFLELPDLDRSEINPTYDTNTCGVPVVKFSYVLAYNSKVYPEAPTSVADFFNTEKFPGKRATANGPYGGLIETALLADGVAPADLYPIDIDRAYAKISTIVGDIVLGESFAAMQDALAAGEYDMALIPNGRALNASKANADIKAVFTNAVTLYDNLAIPVGSPNVEAATAFLQYTARHATQIALTERFPYGVGTVGDMPVLDEAAAGFFPDNYADVLLLQDAAWWGSNYDAVNERWLETFAG